MKNQTAPFPGLGNTDADTLAAMGPEAIMITSCPDCGYPETHAAELEEAETGA